MSRPYDEILEIIKELENKIAHRRSDANAAFHDAKKLEQTGQQAMAEVEGLRFALDRINKMDFPQ